MKYETLKRLISENLDGVALDIATNVCELWDEGDEISYDDFVDEIAQECDSWFTYYSDAWEYLQDENITDFEEAFQEWAVTDICGIACYYAEQRVRDDVWNWWGTYEQGEYEEEDSEESEEEDA